MNNIDDIHEERKESSPSTIELLASLFEESKESKIRRVKGKKSAKSAARKSGAATKAMKDVKKQTSINRRRRQMRLSGSKVEARATKKATQVRKPAASVNVTVKDSGVKAHVQQKRRKIVVEKRSVPNIRKNKIKKISESGVVKKEKPAVLEGCVPPPEVISHPQKRSILSSTTLNIAFPFAMGVLFTFLGTRLVPLEFFDGNPGIALAKNEMVESPAPKKQDAAMQLLVEGIDTAKQENKNKTLEPTPIGLEKETVGVSTSKELNIPVSEIPQEPIVTAKQEVSSAKPELSMSAHREEAERTKTFQRDESKS
jgi:hypothetical protein